ncbi:MAG: PAS domain-containing protein [Alphaproteobacteria bacterium]|nr:PAS domain-containing protein [Alphaproteobacteria bacterium]
MPAAQKQISRADDSVAGSNDLAARLATAEACIAATEARLADAEEVLRDALQSSLSWLWESNEHLCFTRLVGPVEQILGMPAESVIGKSIEEFTHASGDPQIQTFLATIRAHKPYRDVITSITARKGVRWVKSSGKPLFDAEGKFLGYRGIASDVTAQIDTERRAAEAHRRFMEAIETVPASLMLCDRDDRIVFCNSATQRYFPTASHLLVPGTKYEDLLREHAATYVEGTGDNFESWIAERMKTHRSGNSNLIRTYKDGRWTQIIERRTSEGGIIGVRIDITELKKHEKEHEAAQARLKDAIETMPASFILYDHEEKILIRNNQAEKFFPEVAELLVPGTKIEDLSRTRYRRLHPHASEAEIERAVQKRLRQFRNPGVVPPDQLPDGRWTQAIERRTADGGTVCVRIDITELKQREHELEAMSETLRKSQEHLAQAQHTSSTGSMERNLQTGEVRWSEECYRIFGRDPNQAPPNRDEFLLLVHPEDRAKYEASMVASERGLPSEPLKFRIVLDDGAVRWCHCETSVVLDADGKPWKRIGTYRDITIEHEAQEALRAMTDKLRRSQEYLSQAQRLARMGSDFRDLHSDVAEWSDASYEIFGVDKATFVPTTENFLKLVHPEDHAVVLRTRGEIAQGKNPEPFEYRITRPDGTIRNIARECAVEFDDNGKPLYMIGTVRDVTEKRAQERELRRKSQEIEERNEELQRSNAELEQFAYVASHDLQEPLRMVASYCQLLQRRYKDKLDTDANEFIDFAVEGASRMQRLINDLLAYSRVGRKGGDPVPLAFGEVVKAALDNLKGAITESGAKVTVGTLPSVVGVRMQLTQLMQNLIGNAIKFRRDGVTPAISVTASRDGAMWHIVVEDNGVGIEPQYLERVFLIFQRLHERNKYPGTGIGLAIAKKVIEYHGGRIWIESKPGQGSRFNFTLPAAIQNGVSNA